MLYIVDFCLMSIKNIAVNLFPLFLSCVICDKLYTCFKYMIKCSHTDMSLNSTTPMFQSTTLEHE